MEENRNEAESKEALFSKGQLMSSKRFLDRRDLLEALLDEKEVYTVKAVEKKIQKYMKGRVK
jgi:hypothetical protein